MQNFKELVIGLFIVWVLAASYWYTVVHNQLNFANHSEIIDNHLLEILIIISVSFLFGYLLNKKNSEVKNFPQKNIVPNTVKPNLSTKDDLKVVEGIGPAIEKLLNKEGIHTYWQLAETDFNKLNDILIKAGPLFVNHGEKTWAEQATLLRDGKMEEFQILTKSLIGGNRVD
jgi:predicted flap endonuclease-1-like 5' DNA nuclease